jgi:hypothetical protein
MKTNGIQARVHHQNMISNAEKRALGVCVCVCVS